MKESEAGSLKPLAGVDGEPVFEEAWQAQVLGIADTLVRQGLFSAGQWSAALGAELRQAEASGAADDQQTYYRSALNALEALIAEHGGIDRDAMAAMRSAWEDAYLSTPHGQPVELPPN